MWKQLADPPTAHVRRTFHRPTGLTDTDRVRFGTSLEKARLPNVRISLNGILQTPLDDGPFLVYDITESLLPFNEIDWWIDLPDSSTPADLTAFTSTAYLEIHAASM